MAKRRGPYIKSRELAIAAGIAALGAAAFCFRDAYERRNKKRGPVASWLAI